MLLFLFLSVFFNTLWQETIKLCILLLQYLYWQCSSIYCPHSIMIFNVMHTFFIQELKWSQNYFAHTLYSPLFIRTIIWSRCFISYKKSKKHFEIFSSSFLYFQFKIFQKLKLVSTHDSRFIFIYLHLTVLVYLCDMMVFENPYKLWWINKIYVK